MSLTIHGSFLERPVDRHVAARSALLDGHELAAPEVRPAPVSADDPPDALAGVLGRQLAEYGIGHLQLDEPLGNARLLALGERLGEIMAETDPAVQPNVEDARILNLISSDGETADTSRQPFATTALTLHTEGSGRPTDDQPRYIVLMCLNAGDNQNAAQTVLVPFTGVDRRLSAKDREILSHLRYDRPGVPTIRRMVDGRPVFSFRDFRSDTLHWVCDCDRFDADEVREALAGLLAAMYDGGDARGIIWRRGLLAVIDNTHVFHGRSAAPFRGSTRHRHLKRLRIVAPAGRG